MFLKYPKHQLLTLYTFSDQNKALKLHKTIAGFPPTFAADRCVSFFSTKTLHKYWVKRPLRQRSQPAYLKTKQVAFTPCDKLHTGGKTSRGINHSANDTFCPMCRTLWLVLLRAAQVHSTHEMTEHGWHYVMNQEQVLTHGYWAKLIITHRELGNVF